jgi:hypothetical protein
MKRTIMLLAALATVSSLGIYSQDNQSLQNLLAALATAQQ